jgi:polyribonucleotide nucleotidyltransferase
MSLFESISVVALLGSGAWALLQLYFNAQAKLEAQKKEQYDNAIQDLKRAVSQIISRIRELEERHQAIFVQFDRQMITLTLNLEKYSSEMNKSQQTVAAAHSTFEDLLSKMRTLQPKHISEDAYKIKPK